MVRAELNWNLNRLVFSFFINSLIFLTLINLTLAITDSDLSNNELNLVVTVSNSYNLSILYVKIDEPASFKNYVNSSANFLEDIFPTPDGGIKYNISPITIYSEEFLNSKGITLPITDDKTAKQARNEFIKQLDKLSKSSDYDRVIGVAPVGFIENTLNSKGIGFITSPFSSGVLVEGFDRDVVAHEVSHGYPFLLCDEHNINNTWETQDDNRRIGNLFSGCFNGDRDEDNNLDNDCDGGCPVTTFGDLINQPSEDEVSLRGYMGTNVYPDVWSPWDSFNGTVKGFERGFLGKISQRVLMFTGTIFKNGSVELDTPYVIEDGFAITDDEVIQGNITINLTNSSGDTLFSLNFTPIYSTNPKNDSGDLDTNFSYFSFMLPFNETLDKIEISDQGSMLKEVNRTANTPTLSINTTLQNTLISNNFTLAYNTSDADGDTMEYAILISSDSGNTYSTLEIDHPDETYNVNTSGFTEGEQYKVKVLATDGINTNNTVSEGTFEIDNDLRITNLSTLYENGTKRTFYYETKNTLDDTLNNVAEELNTGESTVELTTNHSLNPDEEVMVFIEYDYNTTGDKTLTATATSGSYIETESASVSLPDIEVKDLTILNSTLTKRIFSFNIKNNLNITMTNVTWDLDTEKETISSSEGITLAPDEELFTFIHYDFVDKGTYNVIATVFNSSLNHSQSLLVKVKDIKVENLSVISDSNDIKIFEFILKNDWNTSLTAVNWTLNTGLETITAKDLTALTPNEKLFVYAQYNYASTGSFNVNATGINGTSQDSDVIGVSVT